MALAAWLGAGLVASSTSRALWSDTFALPLCFAGLTVFMRVVVARRATSYWPFLLAALLSLAFMMKPLYAIPSAMLGLIVVLAPEIPLCSKVSFAATCLAFAMVFVVTSFATYGALLPPYFTQRVEPFDPSHILGVLFSPSRGLLWFMPSALLLFFTPFFVLRDRRLFVTGVIAVAAVTLAILSLSGFRTWWGGFSYGPRLFQPALPALALLALITAQAAGDLGRPAQAALLSLFGVVACWEALVHIGGVSSGRGMQWNVSPVSVDDAPERLWDWSDPQFLAAFVKRRPIRDLALCRRTRGCRWPPPVPIVSPETAFPDVRLNFAGPTETKVGRFCSRRRPGRFAAFLYGSPAARRSPPSPAACPRRRQRDRNRQRSHPSDGAALDAAAVRPFRRAS